MESPEVPEEDAMTEPDKERLQGNAASELVKRFRDAEDAVKGEELIWRFTPSLATKMDDDDDS